MNIIILRDDDHWLGPYQVEIRGPRASHIRHHLKSLPGDTLRVGRLGGCLGHGRIEGLDQESVRLHVVLNEQPQPRHPIELVLALPRPKMLRRIFRTCAEYGVHTLHLVQTARVEKSYWQSPLLQPHKVEEALITGLERSRDTIAPQIHLHRLFRPFVEDHLQQICAGRPCWIAEHGSAQALEAMPATAAVVLIGPEGGFVPFELELAQRVIAQPVHLGARILSVDTALTAVLALTQAAA